MNYKRVNKHTKDCWSERYPKDSNFTGWRFYMAYSGDKLGRKNGYTTEWFWFKCENPVKMNCILLEKSL